MKTASVTTNYGVCDKLTDINEKINCLKPIIIKNRDINSCNSLFTTDSEKKDCIKNISYSYDRKMIEDAYNKKDLSICDKIYKEESKANCKKMSF